MHGPASPEWRRSALILGWFASLGLGGCAHTSSEPGVTHYLGWVRVEQPRTFGPDELHVREATSIGLRVGNGIGIGYEHEARVYVPLDCRLVVLVRSELQLDRAVNQLNASGIKEGLCVVPFSP
jgi:hypothetical protein